ncbi:hypothetical protein [Gloeocapsa sp. PCC 73106]|uniref:hypothetical protein n=1 Tax=Gloeocapsa sp. PCC 73106 TaxID=102232 RepID=UPI0002AB9D11|nr:hypothetical protein [Gloeocapsa sp. PCC 73106]ELR99123.1 hypothetical protein GLO73106DRAFT_00029710 [Gloeocapsa sp. PCC 73106]
MRYSNFYPFGLIEVLMLSLAIGLLLVWGITPQWPYLVLSLSYALGASLSVLIRNSLAPYPQNKLNQITAVAIILLSLCSFTDLLRYF